MKIKRTLQPVERGNEIVFGLGNRGLTRAVENTVQNRNLVRFLNGEIERTEVDLDDAALERTIENWHQAGALTENEYDESNRFSRNINFFEWVDISANLNPETYQNRLSSSTVSIIGIGGIGGTVLETLARVGVGKIILVDGDGVEESNVTRQSIYLEKDVGLPKVEAAKGYVTQINSKIIVETRNEYVKQLEDLEDVFRISDLVVGSADKPYRKIDEWFDYWAKKTGTPVVLASYGSTTVNSMVLSDRTVGISEFYERFAITDEEILKSPVPGAIIAPVSFIAAGIAGFQAVMTLTGLMDFDKSVQVDLMDWSVLSYDLMA
jgi:adenylyltransferase/sulfurtransferase